MMKTITQLPREKVLGLALAALTIVAGAWMIYRFGPRPEPAITVQPAGNQPQPVSARAPKAESKTESPKPVPGADLFSSLFKTSVTPVASGRSNDSKVKYLESLEAIYRRRGYRRYKPAPGSERRRQVRYLIPEQIRGKIYWLSEFEGTSTIAALGDDADPNTEARDSKRQIYLTTVSPAKGAEGADGSGSQWATYRYYTDISGLQALETQMQSNGDWPGQDPPEVPRSPGLRRLISVGQPTGRETERVMTVYQSQLRAESLTEWYTKEMPLAGWSLVPPAKSQTGEALQGVLSFTKGNRSCLVWIRSGAGSDPTSVIISARTM
jgi:hypothetical protein